MSIFSKFKNNQAPADNKEDKKDLTLIELKAKKEKEVASSATVIKKTKSENTKNAYKVLVKPLVTEKGTYLVSENKYLFEVARTANKVNVILKDGKKVRYGKTSGTTKKTKKAIVTLKSGQSIQVYEGV